MRRLVSAIGHRSTVSQNGRPCKPRPTHTLWHAEWPSLTWLKEKHPNRASVESADSHAQFWLAYMRASEVLLAAWDEGVFVDMVPGRPLPVSGMLACIE